jgi:hypothetical protein
VFVLGLFVGLLLGLAIGLAVNRRRTLAEGGFASRRNPPDR